MIETYLIYRISDTAAYARNLLTTEYKENIVMTLIFIQNMIVHRSIPFFGSPWWTKRSMDF